MADTPITLKPSAKAAVSRPLKTGAQFTLVVPRKRIVYRHWDKEKYLPGEEGQLTVLAEEMDGEKVKLVVERAGRHDGPFLEVATLEAAIEGGKATAKFTFPRVEPKGRLTRAEWKRKSAKPGEQLGLQVEAQGYEGGSVSVHVERRTSDGRWEVYARWSGEIEQGKFDSIFLVPKGGAMGVQHYRFKVRTSDGRELVSAVATVDPDAPGEGHDDAADTLEELDQKHEEERKQHDQDLASAHEAEAEQHESHLDGLHEEVKAAHEEAIDKLHAAEAARAEAELRAQQVEELGKSMEELHEKHARELQDAADLDVEMTGEGRAGYCAALEDLKAKQEEELRQKKAELSKAHGKAREAQLDALQKKQAAERTEKLREVMRHMEEKKKQALADLQKRQEDEAKARGQQLQERQEEEKRRHEELLKKKDQHKDAPRQAAGGKHK